MNRQQFSPRLAPGGTGPYDRRPEKIPVGAIPYYLRKAVDIIASQADDYMEMLRTGYRHHYESLQASSSMYRPTRRSNSPPMAPAATEMILRVIFALDLEADSLLLRVVSPLQLQTLSPVTSSSSHQSTGRVLRGLVDAMANPAKQFVAWITVEIAADDIEGDAGDALAGSTFGSSRGSGGVDVAVESHHTCAVLDAGRCASVWEGPLHFGDGATFTESGSRDGGNPPSRPNDPSSSGRSNRRAMWTEDPYEYDARRSTFSRERRESASPQRTAHSRVDGGVSFPVHSRAPSDEPGRRVREDTSDMNPAIMAIHRATSEQPQTSGNLREITRSPEGSSSSSPRVKFAMDVRAPAAAPLQPSDAIEQGIMKRLEFLRAESEGGGVAGGGEPTSQSTTLFSHRGVASAGQPTSSFPSSPSTHARPNFTESPPPSSSGPPAARIEDVLALVAKSSAQLALSIDALQTRLTSVEEVVGQFTMHPRPQMMMEIFAEQFSAMTQRMSMMESAMSTVTRNQGAIYQCVEARMAMKQDVELQVIPSQVMRDDATQTEEFEVLANQYLASKGFTAIMRPGEQQQERSLVQAAPNVTFNATVPSSPQATSPKTAPPALRPVALTAPVDSPELEPPTVVVTAPPALRSPPTSPRAVPAKLPLKLVPRPTSPTS